ncbi:MAG: hypothetical protein ABIP20_03880 [Chthoniobacteraceae bacterium]
MAACYLALILIWTTTRPASRFFSRSRRWHFRRVDFFGEDGEPSVPQNRGSVFKLEREELRAYAQPPSSAQARSGSTCSRKKY